MKKRDLVQLLVIVIILTVDRTHSYAGLSKSVDVAVVKVDLDSVTSSDFIGDSGSEKVYATSKGLGDVTVQLKVSPSGITLPTGFVSWTGGSAGADQLQRIVSKSSLIESGEGVTATAAGGSVFNGRIYVFEGSPPGAAVNANVAVTRDDSICSQPFGVTARGDAWTPTETYKVYYESKKWKFVFDTVAYEIKWGINSGGHTDVPNGAANPFPLGMGMPPSSTETQKKTQAKSDLTPDAIGRAPRLCYWSSLLTQRHEQFHASDWRDNYYTPKIQEAETWIETQEEAVTLSNLTPAGVLNGKKPDFHNKVIEKTDEAQAAYAPDKETRAYGDGKSEYQALANSIIP